MCDLCVMNAVKDRMISRRAFFTAGAAAVGGAALVSAGATTPAMAAGHDKVVDMTHAYDADFPTYFGEPGFAAEQKFNFKDNGFNLFGFRWNFQQCLKAIRLPCAINLNQLQTLCFVDHVRRKYKFA